MQDGGTVLSDRRPNRLPTEEICASAVKAFQSGCVFVDHGERVLLYAVNPDDMMVIEEHTGEHIIWHLRVH